MDPSRSIIINTIVTSSFIFEDVSFIADNGIAGYFSCDVKGGKFHSDNNYGVELIALLSSGNLSANIFMHDIYSTTLASGYNGIYVYSGNNFINDYTFDNLIGITEGFQSSGILADISSSGNFYFNNCIGICDTLNPSIQNQGMNIGGSIGTIKLTNCYGISKNGVGIYTAGCDLVNCVAEGGTSTAINPPINSAFYNSENSNYYGCSDSQPKDTGISLIINTGTDTNIENCTLSGGYGILGSTGFLGNSQTHEINIKNNTIRGVSKGIFFGFGTTGCTFNIESNIVSGVNPITFYGATGGNISNNTLISTDYSNVAISSPIASAPPQYQSGNVALACRLLYGSTGQSQLIGSTSSNKGNLIY
jgi:hypothetical protein